MWQAVMLALPLLITAMVVGLAISLFQAVSSIQEQTLSFVPKALGVTAMIVVLLPWMLRSSIEFASAVIGITLRSPSTLTVTGIGNGRLPGTSHSSGTNTQPARTA